MSKKHTGLLTGIPVTYQAPSPAGGVQMETFIPWTLVRRGVRREVMTPIDAPQEFAVEAALEKRERKTNQDTPLLRALGLAHYWQHLLDEGRFNSMTEIAEVEGFDLSRVSRISRLAQLAPSIVEAIATGAPSDLMLETVARRAIPVRWDEQCERLSRA